MIYSRQCPNCNNNIYYKYKRSIWTANKNNSLCKNCYLENKKRKTNFLFESDIIEHAAIDFITNESYIGLSNLFKKYNIKGGNKKNIFRNQIYELFGKDYIKGIFLLRLAKHRNKLRKNFICSDETRQKRSESIKKVFKKNPKLKDICRENMYKYCMPKSQTESAIKKRIESRKKTYPKFTKEHKEKLSQSQIGKKVSKETRKKQRISAINRLKNRYGQLSPNYNLKSIPILEQKAKELEITDLQHAENGGEFYIKELGYWVDGYSKEKNIVIEYYEKDHNKEKRKKRDILRQQEIENFLNCTFIIIKE